MRVAEMFEAVVGSNSPVAIRAFDGSESGSSQARAVINVKSERAVQYLATAPSDLGLARAYVTGEIDIEGDVFEAIYSLATNSPNGVPLSEKIALARGVGLKNFRRPPIPPQEIKMSGRRHSKSRDAKAVSHHYDVSNQFYSWLLGPSMAYTCAVYPNPDATLEEAQREKFDLVCRKLDLRPGMRLLDVGCGWGGMLLHAATEYGVNAIGVTLSKQQADWGAKAIADAGLAQRAEIRHGDYRDIPEKNFDAVSSIGLTEHIGKAQLPKYFGFLLSRLHSEGRLLNHTITRRDDSEKVKLGGFLNRYIFPDAEIEGPGYVYSVMNNSGFEIQHEENFRVHYAKTLHAWSDNLDANWDAAVRDIGMGKARTWRLYLAVSRVGFEINKLQLHQFLGTSTNDLGASGYPLRHTF